MLPAELSARDFPHTGKARGRVRPGAGPPAGERMFFLNRKPWAGSAGEPDLGKSGRGYFPGRARPLNQARFCCRCRTGDVSKTQSAPCWSSRRPGDVPPAAPVCAFMRVNQPRGPISDVPPRAARHGNDRRSRPRGWRRRHKTRPPPPRAGERPAGPSPGQSAADAAATCRRRPRVARKIGYLFRPGRRRAPLHRRTPSLGRSIGRSGGVPCGHGPLGGRAGG